MRILLSFLLFSTVSLSSANAQWTSSQAPAWRHVNGVSILDVNTIVLVGGNPSNDEITGIFRSTDRGVTWSIISDVPFSPWLRTVKFTNAAIGYTAGWKGKIMKTTDGGETWTDKPATGSAANRNYNGMFFLDNNTGYVVGGNKSKDSIQTIIKTTDGGETWNVQRDNLGFWLNSVYFVDANNGYVVGDRGGVLKTTDGGANWTTLTLSGNLKNRNYYDVYFQDVNTGWIIGGNKANDSICTILRTTDGGTNWNIISDGLANQANKIYASGSKIWIAGDNGNILQSTDGGLTFNNMNIADSLTEKMDLNSVNFLNSDLGVFAGEFGKVIIYQNNIPEAPTAETLEAGIFSTPKVRLNGKVNANNGTATVTFEYGLTPSFGQEINAEPATVSGSNYEMVYADLSGIADGVYYYRVKAVSGGGTSYGSMHQIYLGPNPIPNFDFEEWTTKNITTPKEWKAMGTTTKVASYNGSSAVKIETDPTADSDDATSAIIMGEIGDGLPTGGAPFAARPDSLIAYINYEFEPNTEGFILAFFKSGGNVISQNMFTYSGSSAGNFERMAFAIDYQTADIPDTLIIGFANNNPFSGGAVGMTNTVIVDDISFAGTSINIPNADFEQWENATFYNLNNWKVNQIGNAYELWGERTTDAQHGNYAIKIENTGDNGQSGGISAVKNSNGTPAFPVGGRHKSLNGYYKFMPVGNDTLNINVQLFKEGAGIAFGYLVLTDAQNTYNSFTLPIEYNGNTPDVPDSASLWIYLKGEHGAKAYIDNLSFDGLHTTVSIKDVASEQIDVTVYPNPANTFVAIRTDANTPLQTVTAVALDGRTTTLETIQNSYNLWMFNTTELADGMYLLTMTFENKTTLTKRLIIKK